MARGLIHDLLCNQCSRTADSSAIVQWRAYRCALQFKPSNAEL